MQLPTVPSFDASLIRRLTPMSALIAALRTAFATRLRAPMRQTYEPSPAAKLLLMPAWRGESAGGVKVVTVRNDVSPAVLVGTGAPAANLIEAHCSVSPIERVLVWGDPGKARDLIARSFLTPGKKLHD